MSEPVRVAHFHSLCAPIVTSPAPPGPSSDPRPQPPASKELWPNFSQPPLLFGASESFSPRTFSFDLGRKGFLLIERWDSCFSARLGTPLLSASALSYLSGSRRAEVCCARVSEALQLAVRSIPRLVPQYWHSRSQPSRDPQSGTEAGGSRQACPSSWTE